MAPDSRDSPSTADPLAFPTVTDQLYQLASGEVTSVELTRRSLAAIATSQPSLNAFRTVLTDSALADAARADARRAAGDTAVLLGVPIAVKDDTDIAGVPTYFGTGADLPPAPADAEVVRRLRAAGAVIVGKTNMCELGQWPFTSAPAFGHTRNPWARDRTPGGSSGGSAAAVAAGLVAAALGSDGAGSIRIPAAWTHLVGLKPQRGRISTWPLAEVYNGITANGVLARTVADAALVLDAVAGNAEGDLHKPPPVRVAPALVESSNVHSRLDVAISTRLPFTGLPTRLDGRIRAAVEGVADQLDRLGHRVVHGNPDYGLRLSWDFLARSTAGVFEAAQRLDEQLADHRGRRMHWDPRTRANILTGWALSQAVLRAARAHEAASARRIGGIFEVVDVVVAPTTATAAPKVDAFDALGPLGTDRAMIAACPVTFPWNVLGWPAISIPAGFIDGSDPADPADELLPVGVQLLGPAGSEPLLVSLAAELEGINGWSARQPDPWWAAPRAAPGSVPAQVSAGGTTTVNG